MMVMMTMSRDLLLLIRLEIKRIRRSSRYWLRLIGFDPINQSRAVQVYVVLFWMFWIYTMWSYVLGQVLQVSGNLRRADTAQLLPFIPFIVFAVQVFYLVQSLREPPVKLASGDLHYVATAPLSRGMITIINFVVKLSIPALVISLIGTLAAMFFTWNADYYAAGLIGLQAFTVTFLLTYASAAPIAAVGVLKQNYAALRTRLMFWWVVPLFLAAPALIPQIVLLPGQAWVSLLSSSDGQAFASVIAVLVITVIIGFIVLIAAGNRLRMTKVIADSQLYARIHKLGALGRVIAADVILRIRRQSILMRRRVIYQRMPKQLTGTAALVGQSLVTLIRFSPSAVFRLFFSGAAFVSTLLFSVLLSGGISLPSLLILYVLLLTLRPREIVQGFRAQIDQSFMRQFIPETNLRLLVASAAVPFLIVAAGMLIVVMLQSSVNPLFGAVLAIMVLIILSLCLALEVVNLKKLQLPRIAYEYSVLAATIVIVLVGALTGSALGLLSAAGIVIAILMMLLNESEAI